MAAKTKPKADPAWDKVVADMQVIDAGVYPALDMRDVGDIWVGTVVDTRRVRQGKKGRKQRVLIGVNAETGDMVSIWPSAGLRPLVDNADVGASIAIQFVGMRTTSKGREMRDYRLAIKAPDGTR